MGDVTECMTAGRREETGLTEAELSLCSHACALPTGRLQPSLNLSHAVAVVLAQCFELLDDPSSRPATAIPGSDLTNTSALAQPLSAVMALGVTCDDIVQSVLTRAS